MALGLRQRAELEALEIEWRRHMAAAAGSPPIPRHCRKSDVVIPRELECLRGLLADGILAAAARRADAIDVSAERVLIANGSISEEDYVRRLAAWLAVPFDPLAATSRRQCQADDVALIRAVAAGILQIDAGIHSLTVVAPRDARRLIDAVRDYPALGQRLRLTTMDCLREFAFLHCRQEIGEHAARGLYHQWPELSAAPPRWRLSLLPTLFVGLCVFAAFAAAPTTAWVGIEVLLGLVFAAWILLRVAGTLVAPLRSDPLPRRNDRDLPIYSIVIALYRESEVVPALAAALRSLDYPLEKLDIKFVVENDDKATQVALSGLSCLPFEMVIVPAIEPRTKPRALNVALPFVRGSFVVVYDAEDRPEPTQLRSALETFVAERADLACVQASLTIDNTADNWLCAMFTAEYAGQFDVFLPALAMLKLPLPLGGSSNHFRVSHLRAVGGWDAYNVTEDADLGMRLARFGLRTTVTGTATYEEAPALVWPWLCQRTRWFKGWIQTWLVHMRSPVRLIRDVGWPAFIVFQLMVGGNVFAALVHPLFLIWLLISLIRPDGTGDDMTALAGVTIAGGYLASALIAAVGLARRRLTGAAWALALMPLHWLLLSAAAWRALYQFLFAPYRWEKTEHGLARNSRVIAAAEAQVVTLLTRAVAARTIRDIVADRPPLQPASA